MLLFLCSVKSYLIHGVLDGWIGKVATYGTIAAMIGSPKAVRAVGSALRRNPFAPMVYIYTYTIIVIHVYLFYKSMKEKPILDDFC